MVKELNSENINDEIKNNEIVMVDFWAPWCGPCKMIAPTIEKIAEEFSDNALISKINVDENKGIASEYGVRSIPTIILFKNGQEIKRLTGVQSKNILTDELNNIL